MTSPTTAFWGMTINNYDETDLALVQNGYPDYMREIIHTLEKGEKTGTPHIQAWIKLQRQQRLSFVKKLFPRGSFKPLTHDEYVANTKRYAQKLDATAVSGAVHRFNDPLKSIETTMKRVILEMRKDMVYEIYDNSLLTPYRRRAEKKMVEQDYKYAKIFVSATYKAMWKEFGPAMYSCVVSEEISQHTHTHTHSEEKFSREGGITDDATERDDESEGEDAEESGSEEQEDCEGYTEGSCSDDEASTEGGDYGTGEDSSGEED